MARNGWLCLMLCLLGLCGVTGGCSQGFGAHGRESIRAEETPAPAKPMANADRAAIRSVSNEVEVSPASEAKENTPYSGPSAGVRIIEPPPTNSSDADLLPKRSTGTAASAPEVLPPPSGVPTKRQPEPPPKPISPPPPKPMSPPISAPVSEQLDPVISVKPSASSDGAPLIDLHVKDLDVRTVLEALMRQAKTNIYVSEGVAGTVTLDLHDRTLDDVLDAIVKLCRVTVQRDKGVIYVTTAAELRDVEAEDLPVRVYRLNYVKSTDMDKMIKPFLTKGIGVTTSTPDAEVGVQTNAAAAGGNSMAGGEVLLVQDYEQVLKKVDRLVAELDVQPIQVLIEAVIVQVTLSKSTELGINYAVLDGAGKTLAVFGDGMAINAAAGFSPASVLTTAG
jgi:general secretion pathway protein D